MKVPRWCGYTGTIAAIWEAFRNASYAWRYGSPVRYVEKEHSLICHSLAKASTRTHSDKFDRRAVEVEIPPA